MEERFSNVRLVHAGRNLGFAAGNNLALGHAGRAEWIALLNPDAFPEPDWLERLMLAAFAHPGDKCSLGKTDATCDWNQFAYVPAADRVAA